MLACPRLSHRLLLGPRGPWRSSCHMDAMRETGGGALPRAPTAGTSAPITTSDLVSWKHLLCLPGLWCHRHQRTSVFLTPPRRGPLLRELGRVGTAGRVCGGGWGPRPRPLLPGCLPTPPNPRRHRRTAGTCCGSPRPSPRPRGRVGMGEPTAVPQGRRRSLLLPPAEHMVPSSLPWPLALGAFMAGVGWTRNGGDGHVGEQPAGEAPAWGWRRWETTQP